MIDVRGLAVDLGGRRVLGGVTATVPRGSLVGLVGPNGAGKTTLLRAINGVLEPSSGTVMIDGRPGAGLSARERGRLVATVPQSTELNFEFSVRQVVEMGRTPHLSRFDRVGPEDQEAVDRAMARTDVADLAERSITEISGGERSRVLLARALAAGTPALALDEPTASLDIEHQRRTLALIREIVDEGHTAIAAIHDLDLAARFCDRILVLVDGEILAAGDPDAVLTSETIQRAFDTPAAVARAPETGTLRVTALGERTHEATGRIHVVGGGGRASRFLYVLDAAGYDLSIGPLHDDDVDADTADRLDVPAVTVPPFTAIDDDASASVQRCLDDAEAVLVADAPVTEGNLECLEWVRAAAPLVLVEDRPLAERNRAGAAGRRVYDRLRESADVVDPGEVVAALDTAIERGSDQVPVGE